jgi:hypothetical protein
MALADKFLALYSPHSPKSYGEYVESRSDPARTIKEPVTTEAVLKHLVGDVGLGLVPLDGEQSRWGVIDIDNHSTDSDIDLKDLAVKLEHFPGITVTRSKSGGAHVYFFLKESVPGRQIRSLIHQVAMAFGLAGNEVFPKQNKIRKDGFGNWINLPYFGGDQSNRYGIRPTGDRMSLEEFLNQPRTTPTEIESILETLNVGAPPCIQHLLAEPPSQGLRNMALFSLAVFFKRSAPGNWQDKTFNYATGRMDPPLAVSEIRSVVRSVAHKDYTYRCTEAPLVDLCDKAGCKMARHGLSAEQHQQQGEPVAFKSLTKYLTEPPVWDLRTELGDVRLSTQALLSHPKIREAVAEKYLKIVPRMKAEEWHSILSDLMGACSVCEVPDDSTATGLVWNALVDYTLVAHAEEFETPEEDEIKWNGGIPIRRDGVIHFRGNKFIEWLRRSKRAEGMTSSQVYMALRDKGVKDTRIRVGGSSQRSWAFKASEAKAFVPRYVEEDEEF